MRVAVVHDDLTQRGGAERVVVALRRLFPEADLYTSVLSPDETFPELARADVRTSFLQRLPHHGPWARRLLPLYPLAFGRMVPRGYHLVVSSSSRFAHGVRAPGALHVCYCHSPARWLYHQREEYLADERLVPRPLRPALAPVLGVLRRWDRRAARRPDVYVANSRATANRIRELYGREAEIVHPPVEVDRISMADAPPRASDPYLVVSRLLPYKRVDLAVRVCSERGIPLVVIGDGPERPHLETLAGPSVRFVPRVSDPELVGYLRSCRALIQCGEEDFGIAPLEANAAGRPVVAFARGGALETVRDGETGVLFDAQTPEALSAALDRLRAGAWPAGRLREHAERFGEDVFGRRLMEVVERAMRRRTDERTQDTTRDRV